MLFKTPETDDEFQQLFRLNHATFAEEIPQHQKNNDGILIDKYHHINNYIIAKEGDLVVGMISYNGKRPFSLDAKVDNLDSYLPPHGEIVEIRLLAVKKEFRGGGVIAYSLLKYLGKILIEQGYYFGIISGTIREIGLYTKIGFQPFADLVGKPGAQYQPMYITLNQLRDDFRIN